MHTHGIHGLQRYENICTYMHSYIRTYIRTSIYAYTYLPSSLYFFLELQHSVILLYVHHNSTDVPHVYIPSTKIETFVILWYLSKKHAIICKHKHTNSQSYCL